jgi:hypothetical protein
MAALSAGWAKVKVVVNSLSTAPGKRTLRSVSFVFVRHFVWNYLSDPLGCDTESHRRQVRLG